MRTVLVTGFEPFGGDTANPSGEIARALDGWRPTAAARVHGIELPCRFGDAGASLMRAIEHCDPCAVIAVGQAASRGEMSVERVAINLDDARIADNAGRRPIDAEVVAGGPSAYFATLPVKSIALAWQAAGIAGGVSHSAGTFVCNHLFYRLMHALRARPTVRGGFVHVPCVPGQSSAMPGVRTMDLETIRHAIEIAVRTTLTVDADPRIATGTLD